MKRDLEFVRELLIGFSEGKGKVNFTLSPEDQLYVYHLDLLKQADFISFKESRHKSGMFLLDIPKLTWNGNDYLEAISNDTIWQKTKDGIKQKGLELGSVPITLVKEYAIIQAKTLLGIE